ncbi:glycosyltransferase family 2 protein [Sphingomonas mollis]|uniref:Glycosyltransferase family 2 protein n=1 Tax=Sphingomonas mollis TaxID=2795726 RepID=A0ABS0XMQ4_9SPHN|nr:glycosyltransferase family A protein [Sphingomonas sp. BT553]MBJ6121309.1 glycosyltransferase family 2 protein [Sphingomonas sp. BT553]
MTRPLVSVLIPTYNRAQYVAAAIESVLTQTLRDIEVVVVDDGSTDQTGDLLAAIGDPRLRVVRHEQNRGIPTTRNTALTEARGRYIAWLDSDDVSRPTRLAEQMAFLDRHPDIAMTGSCAGKLRADGTRRAGTRVPPLEPDLIAAWMLFRSAFQQSSVMGRAEVLQRYRYDPAYPVCEDADMFLQLQREHRLANMPRVLVDRRIHPDQCVRQCQDEIRARKMALAAPMLDELQVDASEGDLKRHVLLGQANLPPEAVDSDFLAWTHDWLRRLMTANQRVRMVEKHALAMASSYFWILAASAAASRFGRLVVARTFVAGPLGGLMNRSTIVWAKRALPAYIAR